MLKPKLSVRAKPSAKRRKRKQDIYGEDNVFITVALVFALVLCFVGMCLTAPL